MSATEPSGRRSGRVLQLLGRALVHGLRAILLGWATLAIYFSNLPWAPMRLALAAAFAAFGVWALWFARNVNFKLLYTCVFVLVLLWWFSIRPTHEREWRAEVAVMPRASIEGDRVRITGVRNFDYRSRDDFTPHYEERNVQLSDLTAIDFYISYWMPGPIGHTFLSFVFENAPPLSISIEARPEADEGYAPIASAFKQFELIYIVGDERDLVGVRTNVRGEQVYRYRIKATPDAVRELFLVYLDRINELADHAEFYHLLRNNCTINIVRYANVAGRKGRINIRHYLNGLFDSYLYNTGRIDTSLPLQELRRRAHINEAAYAAGITPDFSERIRASAH